MKYELCDKCIHPSTCDIFKSLTDKPVALCDNFKRAE